MDNKKEAEEDYQEKIKKRVEELEKEKEQEPGIVESVVGQFIPGLGSIVKNLEKSSPEFRKRIAETDAEIKHRLETGWSSKPRVDYGISARPLVPKQKGAKPEVIKKKPKEVRMEPPEREPIIDVLEEKDYITVIAELPEVDEKDINIKLKDNVLEISAGEYSKMITLPSAPKSIINRKYKYGILQLKIEKEKNAS
jgi:HSP20 family protein